MRLESFFNSDAARLPKGSFDETRGTFDQYLGVLLKEYVGQLRLIDDSEYPEICSAIKDLATQALDLTTSILTSVQMSLAGRVHLAYREISDGLCRIDWSPFRSELIESQAAFKLGDSFSPYLHAIQSPPLYRIRSDRSEFTLPGRSEIFHVPFEKRRLVGNQRYSVTGLPCLYLGSPLWICWEELGRPALDSVWVSRFRIVKPVSVLDFQFPPHHVWRLFESLRLGTPNALDRSSEDILKKRFTTQFLSSYIICWPLIAACSIRREHVAGSFFPEYIVPQLLLQWVAQEGKVDGIRYFSAQMPSRGMHILAHSNCVFPARVISFKGHCTELKKKFALTEPLSWEGLTATRLDSDLAETNMASNAFSFVQMNRDILLSYSQTEFFDIEKKLGQIESRAGCSRVIDA